MHASTHQGRAPIVLVSLADDHARAATVGALEARYVPDYRIVEAVSAADAALLLDTFAAEGEEVAIVLADHAEPPGSGANLFRGARRLFPDVRRALVIEWGDWADPVATAAVLRLMAAVEIDYYVVRPRHVPDEYFHRGVTDLMLEWRRAVGGPAVDVTVVGHEDVVRTHELRRVLSRTGVRFESATAGETADEAPHVRFADGRTLVDPTDSEMMAAVGLATSVPDETVDLVIVGAGPGGLAAAVYAASEGLSVVVLEREAIGGQAGSSSLIRNYLGFPRGVAGADLSDRAYQQAWVFGARFAHTREAIGMDAGGDVFTVRVAPDDRVNARAVVLAGGVSYKRLVVPGLVPFVGTSVFYGASAVEAKAQTGRSVLVVGGGNSAGQAALHLARYAASVSLVVRGATLAESMSKYLVDQLDAAGVTVLAEQKVVGGRGLGGRIDHVLLRHRATGEETEVGCGGLFITIGAAPFTGWLPPEVLRDKWGYVLTGSNIAAEGGPDAWELARPPSVYESSVPGVFAVGDTRRGSVKRVASAVGEGSVVVSAVHAFLASRRDRVGSGR